MTDFCVRTAETRGWRASWERVAGEGGEAGGEAESALVLAHACSW
eukprot:COSAG02_NODE_5273_length_4480_cov_1.606026_4_plen_45_part_00